MSNNVDQVENEADLVVEDIPENGIDGKHNTSNDEDAYEPEEHKPALVVPESIPTAVETSFEVSGDAAM